MLEREQIFFGIIYTFVTVHWKKKMNDEKFFERKRKQIHRKQKKKATTSTSPIMLLKTYRNLYSMMIIIGQTFFWTKTSFIDNFFIYKIVLYLSNVLKFQTVFLYKICTNMRLFTMLNLFLCLDFILDWILSISNRSLCTNDIISFNGNS